MLNSNNVINLIGVWLLYLFDFYGEDNEVFLHLMGVK